MAGAIHSKQSKIEVSTNGTTWAQIKGVKQISGIGGGSASVIDVTDLDSLAKEKMMGIPDEGQMTLSMNYIPSDPGQLALQDARSAAAVVKFRATFGGVRTFAFDGNVLTAEVSAGVDEVLSFSANVEISGAVVKGTVVA